MKIQSPPLEQFDLRIQFKASVSYSLTELSKFLDSISDFFSEELRFTLPTTNSMNFNVSRPLQLASKDKSHQFLLFSDALQFQSIKYTTWIEEKEKYLGIITKSTEYLHQNIVQNIYMQYVDSFKLPREDFTLNTWFNFYGSMPSNWKIEQNDFHFGISFETPLDQKLVMRLKGREPEDENFWKVVVESIFSRDVEIDLEKENHLFENMLDEGHDLINEKFKELLTGNLRSRLGVIEV